MISKFLLKKIILEKMKYIRKIKNSKPCDVVYRFTDEGEKVRVSKRTGRTIPISSYAEETCDYTTKSNYKRKYIKKKRKSNNK